MKTLTLLFLIFLAACRPGRELVQADMTSFELVSKDTVVRPFDVQFRYRWYDTEHKVFYVVYSNFPYNFNEGETVFGLLRK